MLVFYVDILSVDVHVHELLVVGIYILRMHELEKKGGAKYDLYVMLSLHVII
jgi:hypothetical protein